MVKVALFTLEDVSFLDIFSVPEASIGDGEVTAIRGPSGSGKSTLLRMLNGLTVPTSGAVSYRGTPLERMERVSLRREVVMLGQQPVLFSRALRDDLLAGCRFAQLRDPDDRRLREVLDAVRLHHPLESNPETLSGGEQQRLALARVMLMDPPVVLLDEPSSGLDQETEEVIFQVIGQFRDRGRAVVLATHAAALGALGDVRTLTFAGGVLRSERAVQSGGAARSEGVSQSEGAAR